MSERIVYIHQLTINFNFPGGEQTPKPTVRRVSPQRQTRRERRPLPKRPHIPPEFVNSMAHYVVENLAADGETVGVFDGGDAYRGLEFVPHDEAIEKSLRIHGVTEITIAETVAEDLMVRAEVAAPREHPSWNDQVAGVHRVLFPSDE